MDERMRRSITDEKVIGQESKDDETDDIGGLFTLWTISKGQDKL